MFQMGWERFCRYTHRGWEFPVGIWSFPWKASNAEGVAATKLLAIWGACRELYAHHMTWNCQSEALSRNEKRIFSFVMGILLLKITIREMKNKIKFKGVHPGEILQDAIDSIGITQVALAKHIGCPQSKINDICRGRRGISIEMATRLGRAFNQSTDFWYNLQKQYEIDQFDESVFDDIGCIAA